MTRVTGPLDTLARYARVFQTPLDGWRYAQLRRAVKSRASVAEAKPLRVRTLGGATVLCRPTQDVWTFKHTFLEQFHRPPIDLPEHATIVDLGSNVGYTVADLAHHYSSARVIGVEMDADNFELAQLNTAWLGSRVQIVHAAAWTSDGEISYGGDADDAFAVATKPGAGTKTAPAKSLATLFSDFDIMHVDYVKMDIEGAEAAILSGPMAWTDRVRSLKIEIHPPVTMDTCVAALESRGFRCWVDEEHWNCLCAARN